MSVIVKGMEMPKSCGRCWFNNSSLSCAITGSCIDRDDENRERLDDCPLVALPDHHGRLIDADVLYERACELEAQALAYVGKIINDETKVEEWKTWSAILAERTAFKHDIYDAPTIEPEPHSGRRVYQAGYEEGFEAGQKQKCTGHWIPCSERLPHGSCSDLVNVSIHDDSGDTPLDYTSCGWVTTDGEYWIVDNEINNYVIAWMPLPEPYREVEG